MPRPSPNGMMTPMIEFLSRARTPSRPSSSAATTDPDQGAQDDVRPDQQGKGRAGKGEFGDPVDGEGQVTLHHEGADQPAEQAQDRARPEGVLDQDQQFAVVFEVED